MGFTLERDPEGGHRAEVVDRDAGDRLVWPSHLNHWHMNPWRIGTVEDLAGRNNFAFVCKAVHTPTDNPEIVDCETVIVQWRHDSRAPRPQEDYLARVGTYLATRYVGASWVRRSTWRCAPELEAEYLAHNPG